MNNLEALIEEINVDKEILNTLPQNNKKNISIYLQKAKELYEKYDKDSQNITNEMTVRAKKYDENKVSEDVQKISDDLSSMECVSYLLNEIDSSYEKMDLDREIFNLTYYYKKNLEKVNETISFCIRKFEEVGVKISPKDFFFNKYVSEYITELYKGIESNNINKDKIKDKFEEIYWKCPEIITYIELNIRYIFLKHEKEIDKYYKIQKDKLLKKFSKDTIKQRFLDLKRQNIEINKMDETIIRNGFLNNEMQTKEYTKTAIIDIVNKFTSTDVSNITDEEFDDIVVNLIKLLNTIEEYKNYNKFKFVIDNVKLIYAEKEKYKGAYAKLKKELSSKEKKMIKLGKPGIFRKPNDKNLAKQTQLIIELKVLYKELDKNKVYEKIVTSLNEYSTLYDVLYLASSFYMYIFKCITGENEDIEENDVANLISELKEFLNWPYFTILNNIKITEEKDILLIIKDRYNLLNINITKEDLGTDNLDSLIELLEKCEVYHNIKENKIDLQEIAEIYEFKKILNNM